MPFTLTNNTEAGDCYCDTSETDKHLIRSTLKTNEKTWIHVFLKLFQKATDDFEFEQRIRKLLENLKIWSERQSSYRTRCRISSYQQNQHWQRKQNLMRKLLTTMVEALFGRSPNYLNNFRKSSVLLKKNLNFQL